MVFREYDGRIARGLLIAAIRVGMSEICAQLKPQYEGRLAVRERRWPSQVRLYTWQWRRFGPFRLKRWQLLGLIETEVYHSRNGGMALRARVLQPELAEAFAAAGKFLPVHFRLQGFWVQA